MTRADANFSCIAGRSAGEFPLVLIRLMPALQMFIKVQDYGVRNSCITLEQGFSRWFLTTFERAKSEYRTHESIACTYNDSTLEVHITSLFLFTLLCQNTYFYWIMKHPLLNVYDICTVITNVFRDILSGNNAISQCINIFWDFIQGMSI